MLYPLPSDKPPIEDLQYFLDFQISRVWAPEQNNLQRKEPVCPFLQFSLMGPKLYISPDQVYNSRIAFFRFLNVCGFLLLVHVTLSSSCLNEMIICAGSFSSSKYFL